MADERKWRSVIKGGFLSVVIILSMFAMAALYQATASIRGYLAAKNDIAHGRYVILSYDSAVRPRPEYIRLLKARYGIETVSVANHIDSIPLFNYVDAYDDVSEAAAEEKFGSDIFKATWEDAYWKDHPSEPLASVASSPN